MDQDGGPSKAELLNIWRDAARAAELAERMASAAAEAADQADERTLAAVEIAQLAEEAATAASKAAERATAAATRASALGKSVRERDLVDANERLASARDIETAARDAYQQSSEPAESRTDGA